MLKAQVEKVDSMYQQVRNINMELQTITEKQTEMLVI